MRVVERSRASSWRNQFVRQTVLEPNPPTRWSPERPPAGTKPALHHPPHWHPIVASNRGPIEYALHSDGSPVATRASGGVVTALSALARHTRFTWIATAATEGDRHVAKMPQPLVANPQLRFVDLPRPVYHHHYNVFSNPLLWFLQHAMWQQVGAASVGEITKGWSEGYLPANAAFAAAIAREGNRATGVPVVMLQDYHLYAAPYFVRRLLPNALLQHFVHIPWPGPEHWLALPADIGLGLFRGLLSNDIVGFQTKRDASAFLSCCSEFMPEATVDYDACVVTVGNHETMVRVYPISIDVGEVEAALQSRQVVEYRRRLAPLCGERTIVRVDRLDPTKDVANGFRAFDRLLSEHPEWVGRVKFLAFLVPSRGAISEYRRYAAETFSVVAEINAKYAHRGYQPIEVFHENNRLQALAGLSLYDALLVNPLADGMNLVAKEGPIANDRDGVLILSQAAGAHEALSKGALSVLPGDVPGAASALARALDMAPGTRRTRAAWLRQQIVRNDLGAWFNAQFADIDCVMQRRMAAQEVDDRVLAEAVAG